jgi:hypothetical protein
MKAQPKCFVDSVFESVSSDSFNIDKITSPLVKINGVSEKSSGGFVGGLVVDDTINDTISATIKDTIKDTINSLSDNERTVFEEMQAHPKVTANELSEILNINLRNTKKIIEKLET